MNKNSTRILTAARKAFRSGELEFAIDVPSGGYHNNPKGVFKVRRVPKVASRYKKKARSFPNPNKDVDMGLITQHKLFYGPCSKWN